MAIDWKKRLKKTSNYDYDDWLEFFRKLPKQTLEEAREKLEGVLPADGYAALLRWLEIMKSPSKMDKLYKGRLAGETDDDIMDVAIGDDDEKFYETLIRQNTAQLNSSNISQQEVARLSQNINIFRKELKDIRSRRPKAGSVLEKILTAADAPPKVRKVAKKTPIATKKKAKTAPKATRSVAAKKTGSKSSKVVKS